jgi:hypothetical protein
MSAFVALTEKRIPFEVRTLDLAIGANNDPEYARTSLTQRVPTLIDGDFALSESSAIAEYLNDAYPDPRYSRPTCNSGREPVRFKPGCEAISCRSARSVQRRPSFTGGRSPRRFLRRHNSRPENSALPPANARPWRQKPVRPLVDRRCRSHTHAQSADTDWRRSSGSPGPLCEDAMGTAFRSAMGSKRTAPALKARG